MEPVTGASLAQLPDEMFEFILQQVSMPGCAGRLGQLILRGRPAISTPNYVVPTSRGVIPHLSQDNLQKHTNISTVYVPLEDFIEKSHAKAPLYNTPAPNGESPLRRYIGLPDRHLSIFGLRRVPNIPCPAHNTDSSVAISTSVGFRSLEVEQYHEAVRTLKADISTSLPDLINTKVASVKRIEKSADRTHAWLRDFVEDKGEDTGLPFFASIPPHETELLSLYLSDLKDEYNSHISGLCVYSPSTVTGLPGALRDIPTVCLTDPSSPQAVLAAIHAGVDLLTVPFVTQSSEHGIAFSFTFPGCTKTPNQPLGFDLWSTTHATDLSTLSPNCTCYTCTRHHRAYVHHLLQANEMLAWTLLQIHNFSVIDAFFSAVRQSIKGRTFEDDMGTFGRAYESELPALTGQGPRVRGYQMKSIGRGEPKKNAKAYGKLGDQVQKLAEAESGIASPQGDADDIEGHGLA
ncbi:uncharacterized protein Z519_00929 [Cladophialophora bantiana CBS 173.52]|uniref:Queuine tRNA-ribosyltransferase accessory subunit 2 n=1 Tax=Cladophialophora bantiana (strain ATCC 10958 / CBS 173.52 / CDC B-1940 / NIH 8579) TaxID=1442370 RepID=A0A0D2FAW8_CLAB1|nr:uncharacterized protein Z519_00929 [Cladophialophora bantiana CBS 173.52]KIW99266.1 hypothetical protein Z519_00929 [Cladophialophora bantiana CBS 173.52]